MPSGPFVRDIQLISTIRTIWQKTMVTIVK